MKSLRCRARNMARAIVRPDEAVVGSMREIRDLVYDEIKRRIIARLKEEGRLPAEYPNG